MSSTLPVLLLALALMFAGLSLAACQQQGTTILPKGTPSIKAPTIVSDGILTVGVNSSAAPFAGQSSKGLIGIDVDVAAALAEQLGLQLKLVDTNGQDGTVLLSSGQIDLLMNYQPSSNESNKVTEVGPYLVDGPAIFSIGSPSAVTNFDPSSLKGLKVAAQANSLSSWELGNTYGQSSVQTFNSLDEAFATVSAGNISYAAADAVVGAYLAPKYNNMVCLGFLNTPTGVYIGVSAEKQDLTDAVTKSLQSLKDNGVLKVIVNKWLGTTAGTLVRDVSALDSDS